MNYFRYAAPYPLPGQTGIAPGTIDTHGQMLVSPDLVPTDSHLNALTVSEGTIFTVTAANAYLAQWLDRHRSDGQRTFPRATQGEVDGAGKSIKELKAARQRVHA
jgi:hypothetical protein